MSAQPIPKKDSLILSNFQFRFRFDVWIALFVFGLLIAGFLTVASASPAVIIRNGGDPTAYVGDLKTQVQAFLLGMVAIFILLQFDYHVFRNFSLLIIPVLLGSLILVLLIGQEGPFGARRGLFGNSYQPSEVAKLLMILYTSHWLSSKGDRLQSIQSGWFPFAIMVGSVCGLIMSQPDISTSGLIALTCFTMFFLAGATWRHTIISMLVGLVAFGVVVSFSGYGQQRVQKWRVALEDPQNADDQIRFTLIALANGGLTGKGLGDGEMKYRLQAAHTDAPFAVWGEEFGFLGSLFIMASFGGLAWRGFLAARQARDMYGFLLAIGVTCWLTYQALMNIAVATSTMPFTGIPLPFMSAGGTSMTVSLAGVGILLNISRDNAIGRTLKRPPTNKRLTV